MNIEKLYKASHKLDTDHDLDVLIERIGDARYVLLGEASHGTSEYYTWRSKISRRLIEEKGFSFIAVEGDWPDCYMVNRYIKGYPDSGTTAKEVLKTFDRWPTWMWANWEVVALTEWLKTHNERVPKEKKAGFYGLDVYSLWESMEAIIKYLEKVDPAAVKVAKEAYQCFAPYEKDEQAYARATRFVSEVCEDEVVEMFKMIRSKTKEYAGDAEAAFSTEQNALVSVNAERYYRAMVKGSSESWNIRDTHMNDTLNRLMKFHGTESKAIVWEHNTHIGDARATDMKRQGMVNVGQLVREQHEQEGVFIVGFGAYQGGVIAADEWGAPMQEIMAPPAQSGSWEAILHEIEPRDRIIMLDELQGDADFMNVRGHRAIGVVYHPHFEKYGNFVPTVLPARYNAFIFIDETEALHPLHIRSEKHRIPETFPWGM